MFTRPLARSLRLIPTLIISQLTCCNKHLVIHLNALGGAAVQRP